MSETLTTRLDRAIRNGFVGPDAANEMNRLLQEAAAEIERLEAALNPRQWNQSLSDAWHRNIPDTTAAFRALREAPRGYVPGPVGSGGAR